MVRPFKCPYCSSTRTTWKGYRKTQEGTKRIRKCSKCNRRFTINKISHKNVKTKRNKK